MRRALALACAEVPPLENVKVTPDGSLKGLGQLAEGVLKPSSGAPCGGVEILEQHFRRQVAVEHAG